MKYIFLIFILIASLQIFGQVNTKFTLNHINDKSGRNISYCYILPRTVFKIKVTALRKDLFPGPYREYAEDYLGISNGIKREDVKWEIGSLTIEIVQEPDPEQCYALSIERGELPLASIEKLNQAGLILKYSSNNQYSYKAYIPGNLNDQRKIPFMNYGYRGNTMTGKDTIYKKLWRDTAYIDVPIIKEIPMPITFEKKAEETASYIYSIRKKKINLVSGKTNIAVNETITEALKALNDIEQEYVALFIGKTITDTVNYTFYAIPAQADSYQKVLFRISDDQGILNANSAKGNPVLFELSSEKTTEVLKNIEFQSVDNTLIYRIPDVGVVSIKYDDETLFEDRFYIFQIGAIVSEKLF